MTKPHLQTKTGTFVIIGPDTQIDRDTRTLCCKRQVLSSKRLTAPPHELMAFCNCFALDMFCIRKTNYREHILLEITFCSAESMPFCTRHALHSTNHLAYERGREKNSGLCTESENRIITSAEKHFKMMMMSFICSLKQMVSEEYTASILIIRS